MTRKKTNIGIMFVTQNPEKDNLKTLIRYSFQSIIINDL
jgi:hypothetical protein